MSLPDELSDPAWAKATHAGRMELAVAAFEAVRAQGHVFSTPTLRSFGPPEKRREVATAVEKTTGIEFSLVTGGTYEAGLDDEHYEKLLALVDEHGPERESALDPIRPYGVPSDINFASSVGEVEVSPFLLARFPVTRGMPRLREFLSEDTWRTFENITPNAPANNAQPMLIEEVGAAEQLFNWRLPEIVELEWAISAGSPQVFYWGNTFDHDRLQEEAGEHPLLAQSDCGDDSWPAATAFGLRGAVGISQWCWLPVPGHGRAPLVRGGAGRCAPWQRCGEYLWMVNFMNAPQDALEEHQLWHAFRPSIPVK